MSEARLILTCGLPGAGKSALARQLAADRSAVRLTKDEWLTALGSSPWDTPTREKVEHELWRLAQEILRLGLSVVLDFGLWARAERDEMRSVARGLGLGVELHYLDVPTDELWRRIEARNSEPPWDSYPIRRADLDGWLLLFPGARCCRAGLVRPAARLKLTHYSGRQELQGVHVARPHRAEVLAVERGELGLVQALDDREDGRVDEPDVEIRVPLHELDRSIEILEVQLLDVKLAAPDATEERRHGIRPEPRVGEVIDLTQRRCGYRDLIVGGRDQLPTSVVVLLAPIHRCDDDIRVEDEHQRSSTGTRSTANVPAMLEGSPESNMPIHVGFGR